MIAPTAPSATRDPEGWKQWIIERARVEVPAWLRSIHAQRLQTMQDTGATTTVVQSTTPIPASAQQTGAIAAIASPTTPPPEDSQLPETGGMPRLDTIVIPVTRLLKPTVRDTREIVSQAITRFFTRHGYLPSVCFLNPLRVLTIASDYYPLDDHCAEFGCYTIRVEEEEHFPIDAVRLMAHYGSRTIREDYSLS